MNGMTPKELEKEKMTVGRMCFELKAKRQVTLSSYSSSLFPPYSPSPSFSTLSSPSFLHLFSLHLAILPFSPF